MGLYNFKPQFVPFLLDGSKTHTIRATRKHPDKPGDTLHLYTGLRRKGARLLMRVECVKVEPITILYFRNHRIAPKEVVIIDRYELNRDECEVLARRDGFSSFGEMMSFWDGRTPFEGQIIHWKAVRATAGKPTRTKTAEGSGRV